MKSSTIKSEPIYALIGPPLDERFLISSLTKSRDSGLDGTEEDVSISEEVSNYIDEIVAVASTEDYDYIKEQFAIFIITDRALFYRKFKSLF